MKRILLSVSMFWAICCNAQVLFFDDFSNQALPKWTIVNHSGSTVAWEWSDAGSSAGAAAGTFDYAGTTNGHLIVDSDLDGEDTVYEYSTITSKAINCTGKTTVILSFWEYFAHYQSDTAQVLISTDSVNWTALYNPAVGLAQDEGIANPTHSTFDVSSIAGNQATVYLRFSWKGSWDYWWFIDDVELVMPSDFNLEASEVVNRFTNGCNLTNAEQIGIRITNKGLSSAAAVTAYYSINGGTVVSESVPYSNIGYDSVITYTFTATADLSAANNYAITAWVSMVGDTIHSNDTAVGAALSINPVNLSSPMTWSYEVPPIGSEIEGFTWTTFNANNDVATWGLAASDANTGSIHYRYFWNSNGTTGANDWLFSPCLDLNSTKAYKVTFFNEVGQDNNGLYEEKLRLKMGMTKTPAGMNENIFDFGALDNTTYEERKAAFKPANTGTYYVGFHCYSDPDKWFLNIDDVTIGILAPPTAQFTTGQSGSNVSVTDGSDEMITKWEWDWNDGTTDTGQAPPAHTYGAPATYTICLKVTNLAGSDSTCRTVTITDVQDLQGEDYVSIFPNPTNGLLNIWLNEDLRNNAKVEIINSLGEVVMHANTVGNSTERINLEKLAKGVYVVKITAGKKSISRKFVYAY